MIDSGRVLVFSQDDAVQVGLKTGLLAISPSFQVDVATTESEALEKLRMRQFRAFFVDCESSDASGTKLLKKTYNAQFDTGAAPTILILPNAEELLMVDALQWGAQAYLKKDRITKDACYVALAQADKIFHLKKALWHHEKRLSELENKENDDLFIQNMVHDFSNVMTVILGNTKTIIRSLQRTGRNDNMPKDMLEKIQPIDRAAQKGMDIVNKYNRYMQQKTQVSQIIDLQHTLTDFTDYLKSSEYHFGNIELVVADDAWSIQINVDQLKDTLFNIATNSDYTRSKFRNVVIEAQNVVLDQNYSMLHDHVNPGDYVMITMSNTGGRQRDRFLQYMMYPIFLREKKFERTETGFKQAYNFVHQANGYIHIYSEKNYGTVVRLYLPRAAEPAAVLPHLFDITSEAPMGTETILLIDDDIDIRQLAGSMLEELGYKVFSAENGSEALAILKNRKVDLVFSDLVLAGEMNGAELIKKIKRRSPHVKVLFTSGFTESVIKQYRIVMGDEFISKPYRKEALANKIRHVLGDLSSGKSEEVSYEKKAVGSGY